MVYSYYRHERNIAIFESRRIEAHRGARSLAPENTIAAFRKAAEVGAGSIETDLSLLACGSLAVFHDATLGRTAPGTAALADLDAGAIAELDAGDGERIPLLKDALAFQKETGMRFNWEVKCHSVGDGIIAEAKSAVAAMAAAMDETGIGLSMISSFSREVLAAAREALPSLPRALIATTLPHDWREAVDVFDLEGVHLGYRAITAEVAQEIKAHERGLALRTYTVNDRDIAARLLKMGVDTIITDCPERFLA